MADCIFCRIVAGAIPAHIIAEGPTTLAFLDLHPINPGHALVIPKRHEPDLFELGETEYLDLMLMTRRIAAAVKTFSTPARMGLLVAGWDVPHAHVHVVPMHDYHDLTSKRILEGNLAAPGDDELSRIAGAIRSLRP